MNDRIYAFKHMEGWRRDVLFIKEKGKNCGIKVLRYEKFYRCPFYPSDNNIL